MPSSGSTVPLVNVFDMGFNVVLQLLCLPFVGCLFLHSFLVSLVFTFVDIVGVTRLAGYVFDSLFAARFVGYRGVRCARKLRGSRHLQLLYDSFRLRVHGWHFFMRVSQVLCLFRRYGSHLSSLLQLSVGSGAFLLRADLRGPLRPSSHRGDCVVPGRPRANPQLYMQKGFVLLAWCHQLRYTTKYKPHSLRAAVLGENILVLFRLVLVVVSVYVYCSAFCRPRFLHCRCCFLCTVLLLARMP